MSKEEKLQHGVTPPHEKTQDQQTKNGQDIDSSTDDKKAESNEESNKGNNQGKGKEAQKADEETVQDEGKEGDPKNPSKHGNIAANLPNQQSIDTAKKNIREEAKKRASVLSWTAKGMNKHDIHNPHNVLKWANVTKRPSKEDSLHIRLGDTGIIVKNPGEKLLKLPRGYPVLINTTNLRIAFGAASIPAKHVMVPEPQHLDRQSLTEEIKTVCQQDKDAEKVFEEIFFNSYFHASEKNWLKGKIGVDDDQTICIVITERTDRGQWVGSGKMAVQLDLVHWGNYKPVIGDTVRFTTQLQGSKVIAHKILPCALLGKNLLVKNTQKKLPSNMDRKTGKPNFFTDLQSATSKTIGSDKVQLIVETVKKNLVARMGEGKWAGLKQEHKNPIDIFVTDNPTVHKETSAGAIMVGLSTLILFYNRNKHLSKNPLCWKVLKQLITEEDQKFLNTKFLSTGIGMTMMVETEESLQKQVRDWASASVIEVVADRNRNRNETHMDSIGVLYSFGNLVTPENFNELITDSFFTTNSTGIQSIKIFDTKITSRVTYHTDVNGVGKDYIVDTDRGSRGGVFFSLEAVTSPVSEEKRLETIITGEAAKAISSVTRSELMLKFKTSKINCLLFQYLKKNFGLTPYVDSNPSTNSLANNNPYAWRRVQASLMELEKQDECFEEMLKLVRDYPDFYLMKRDDLAGTDTDTKTYVTVGTDFYRTTKALSALQHRFDVPMQLMGLNGSLTRIAIQGKFSLDDILLGVKKVNTVVPNSIKLLVFQNKLHHLGSPESKNGWSSPNHQPHYSKYVIAVAGFPCPLNEAEIESYFVLAGGED